MTPEEKLLQIRRAHKSARPKTDNPAWFHTHNDLTFVLAQLDAALSQAEADRVDAERYRWLRNFASPRQRPAPEDMPLSYYPVLLRCDTAVYSPATWGADVDRLVDAARKASPSA